MIMHTYYDTKHANQAVQLRQLDESIYIHLFGPECLVFYSRIAGVLSYTTIYAPQPTLIIRPSPVALCRPKGKNSRKLMGLILVLLVRKGGRKFNDN